MGRTRFTLYAAAPDLPRLAEFLASSLDWTARVSPDGHDVQLTLGAETVVTAIAIIAEAIPGMLTSFQVEDTERVASEAERLGARVVHRYSAGETNFIRLSGRTGETFAIEQAPKSPRPVSSMEARLELWTGDIEAALHFYTELFGWTVETRGGSAALISEGTLISTVGRMDDAFDDFAFRRAIGQIDPDAGRTVPHFMSYCPVRSVDDCLGRCRFFGGHVVIPPSTIPIGSPRALVRDPQGAHIGIREP